MNRLLCAAIAALTLLTVAEPASACGRCGIFGRGCRFQSHHVAHVAYQAPYVAPATTTNFTFVNSFPVPFLQQGNSAYAYSLAAPVPDNALYMNQSNRHAELSLELAGQAIGGHNASIAGQTALVDSLDRRQTNRAIAIAAFSANDARPLQVSAASAPQIQSQSFRVTVKSDGSPPVVDYGGGGQTQQPNPGNFQDFSTNVLESCVKCHDGQGTHGEPRDVDFTKPISWQMYERSFESVRSGKMPKGAPISDQHRFAILKALPRMMVANQAQQPEQPLPPPPVPNGPDNF